MSGLSVSAAARAVPSALAIRDGAITLDYATLAGRVAYACETLLASGLEPNAEDALVALTPKVTIDSVVAILACLELGVPFVALHPRSPEAERARALARVRPTLVLQADATFAESRALAAPRAIDPERALAVLFTSGSSGTPKPIVLSRRAFLASAGASAERLPLGAGDRWLLALPPAHVGGLSVIVRTLVARTAIDLGGDGPFDPDATRAALDAGATIASLVPTTLGRVLDSDPSYRPPQTLRAVLLGGAAAPDSLLTAARMRGFPLRGTYGLTEACSQVATWSASDEPGAGRPLAGVEVRILDDEGAAVATGSEGEIAVRAATLCSGTWPLADSPSLVDGDGYFHTGDIGHLDADGFLHVHARRSDLILSGGENVYPAEVEAELLAIAGVRAACVVGTDDADLGQRVAVALVLAQTDAERVLAALRLRLAGYKVPRIVRVVEALPHLPSGKVDRRAVAAIFGAPDA